MTHAARLGAHWTALLAVVPEKGDLVAIEQRLERALACATAVAWEWDVSTGDSRLCVGDTALLSLKDDPTGGFYELVHPEDRGWLRPAVVAAARGESDYDFEFRLLRPDGGVEWVRDRGRLERDGLGRPFRLSGVAQTITAQKQAEIALVDSEARFRATFEQAAVGMAHVAPDGCFLKVNDCLCRLLGRPREALLRLTFQELTHPDDLSTDLAQVQALLDGRITTYTMEKRYLLPHGGAIRANLTVSLVRDESGGPNYFIAVIEDISACKASNAAPRSRISSSGMPDDAFARALLDGGPNCVKLLDADGRLLWANAQALRALEIDDLAAIRGRPFVALWPEAEQDAVRAAVAEARAGGRARFRAYGPTAKGAPRWWAVAVWPLPGDDGRVVALSHDVTDAHLAAEARRESDALARRILETTSDWIMVLDATGRIAFNNEPGRRGNEITDLAGVIGRPVEDLWPSEWLPALRSAMAKARAGDVARCTAFGPTARTLPRWWDITVSPLSWRDGEAARLLLVARDVTEQRGAEQALAQSEAWLRILVDEGPVMVWTMRADGQVDYVNARWCAFTGVPDGSMVGHAWHRLAHPDDLARLLDHWHASQRTGEPYECEHRLRHHDGGYRWVLARAIPVRDAAGGITRWFGSCTEISEIVLTRDTLSRSRDEMEALATQRARTLSDAAQELQAEIVRREAVQAMLLQSQKLEALGQLTGGVAHDFNNVLAAVIGSYSLIRRRTDSPAVLEIVSRGEQAAERARKLVAQLLAFARRGDLKPESLDIASVLRGTEDLVCHAVGHAVRCALDVPDGLWPVLADAHQLEVALLNLSVNARDAMPQGGTLTIAARNLDPLARSPQLPPGDYVAVTVRDTGEGMSPEVAARATEPFFTTKPQGRGTGLGLAMVHGFVAQSGGALRIESALGNGTTVEIILPRAAVSNPAEAADDAPPPTDPLLHGDATILLAEDDDQVRPMLSAFLRDLGYIVAEAANGEAACVLLHTLERCDLLITDVAMPGMDGPALAAQLRAERPELPVLFVTGHPPGPALAGEIVVRKPFAEADLAAAVLGRLGRSAARTTVGRKLLSRLRTPALRRLYFAWESSRQDTGALPLPGILDPARFGLAAHAFEVAIEREPQLTFRYVTVGTALVQHLGRSMVGETVNSTPDGDEVLGALEGAYRRCARTLAPVYQAAQYDFGDGAPLRFERLLLPLSNGNESVTHMLGIVLFDGSTE